MANMWLITAILNPANWLLFVAIVVLAVGFFYVNRIRRFIFDINSWIGLILGAGVFGWMAFAYAGQQAYQFFNVKNLEAQNIAYKARIGRTDDLLKRANMRANVYETMTDDLNGELDDAMQKLDQPIKSCTSCIVSRSRVRLHRGR